MTTHDLINAIFEGGGACFLLLNVRRLLKDKSVKGVSLLTTAWWTAWGFWNVYFYAAVSCSASFWAGIAVVLANAVWLALAVYYARAGALANGPADPLEWHTLSSCAGTTRLILEACECASFLGLRAGQVVAQCCKCGGVRSAP